MFSESVINKYGERLCGILHSADSSDLVLVVHGFASSMSFEPIIDICRTFQTAGVNAFRFDWSGHGCSEGHAEDCSFLKRSDDLYSVISHFNNKGYRVTSVIGHSAGATAAIIQAATNLLIESLILIAPRLDLTRSIVVKAIKESGKSLSELIDSSDAIFPMGVQIKGTSENNIHYFGKAFIEEFRDLDVYNFLKSVHVPISILVGTEDRRVGKEELKRAFQINNSISLILLDDAGHTFWRNDQRTRLVSTIMDWYKLHFNVYSSE